MRSEGRGQLGQQLATRRSGGGEKKTIRCADQPRARPSRCRRLRIPRARKSDRDEGHEIGMIGRRGCGGHTRGLKGAGGKVGAVRRPTAHARAVRSVCRPRLPDLSGRMRRRVARRGRFADAKDERRAISGGLVGCGVRQGARATGQRVVSAAQRVVTSQARPLSSRGEDPEGYAPLQLSVAWRSLDEGRRRWASRVRQALTSVALPRPPHAWRPDHGRPRSTSGRADTISARAPRQSRSLVASFGGRGRETHRCQCARANLGLLLLETLDVFAALVSPANVRERGTRASVSALER